jgi:probable HAF family extracellular repeat protein
MSIPTWARLPRAALAAAATLAFFAACDDLTGPREDLGDVPRMRPAPHASPAVVPITPAGVSSTGVPVLPLPLTAGGFGFSTPIMAAINESNWVAGTGSQGGQRAILWRGGTEFELIPRPTAFAAEMRGMGLNDVGMVVGEWDGLSNLGFRWSDADGSVLLPNPPAMFTGGDAQARDVDASGNIIVFYWRDTSSCEEAGNITNSTAVLRPGWAFSDYELVPPPLCQTSVSGTAIDQGAVVGRLSTTFSAPNEAFHWDDDGAVELLGDWHPRDVEGIYIAGQQFTGGVGTAVRAAHPGPATPLGTLPGGTTSNGLGVNGLGWVVGSSTTASGETHAFLWTPDGGIIDLGTLGGTSSRAVDVNDQGYIVGEARNMSNQLVPVIWFVDPAGSDNEAPDVEAIISQIVTVGNQLVVTPVVTDAENDPFTISWSGDVPDNAVLNNVFEWTPTAEQVGDHTITVTATQDDDPTLFDSETFVVSVLPAAVLSADLQVSVGPAVPQQQFLGDAVGYLASIHNAGPDAVIAALTVALEYRDQADWGTVPPEGAINGIFFLEVAVAADQTVDVPFEVTYNAFGVQGVTATVAGDFDELQPSDNEGVFDQVVDLAFTTPGVQTGGLDVPGTNTTDGLGLAVVGVRIPSVLIAGDPGYDLFLPGDLTPASVVPGDQLVPGGSFTAGSHFVPSGAFVGGALAESLSNVVPTEPSAAFIPAADHWLGGRIFVPAISDWDPLGRLLFQRGSTDVRVNNRANTTLGLEKGNGVGMKIDAVGGTMDADLGLCAAGFQALVGAGDEAEFACGSLTTTVLTGEISIVLADGTRVDVAAGAEVRITEDGLGGWDVELLTGDPEDVVITPPVTNGDPVAVPGGPYVAAVGQSLTLDGSGSTDPDGDPLTYEWVLDDGSVSGVTAMGVGPTIVVPLVPDLYLLALTVTDPDGAMSTSSVEVAVYDPERSSVTGGGWFHSAAGALVANPAAEGRANFAFHVAYRKGRSIPDGHARLAFEAGNLRLDSELFDWLVVGGEMARFRGIGDLEGHVVPVRFEVVARDPDRIQVRIWDDGGDIYDSGEVYIGGGQIVIKN